jgi:transcriptional regulator with XRE-family HTH domain
MKPANSLQTIMRDKNLSYEKLARRCGVSASTIYRIAIFEQSPTQKVMIAIARGLRMKVTDVFNLDY